MATSDAASVAGSIIRTGATGRADHAADVAEIDYLSAVRRAVGMELPGSAPIEAIRPTSPDVGPVHSSDTDSPGTSAC